MTPPPSPLKTEQDFDAALIRIEALMDAIPGTPEFDELDQLSDLVAAYENEQWPE